MAQRYFIAGTDTGVGKTRVTAGLLAAGRARGLRVAGMKPVAAGAIELDGRLINDDALMIAAGSGQVTAYDLLNPYCLPDPLSPHIAAERAGVTIDTERIVRAANALARDCELLLIEGAGGWYAPISASETMADAARALGAPVILVVGLRLGCLNHALLSARAIRADGARLAGWIGSEVDAQFAAREQNLATLERLLGAPPLALLPHAPTAAMDAAWLAAGLAPLLAPHAAMNI